MLEESVGGALWGLRGGIHVAGIGDRLELVVGLERSFIGLGTLSGFSIGVGCCRVLGGLRWRIFSIFFMGED